MKSCHAVKQQNAVKLRDSKTGRQPNRVFLFCVRKTLVDPEYEEVVYRPRHL